MADLSGTASRSACISITSTIDVSSTTIRSQSSRFSASIGTDNLTIAVWSGATMFVGAPGWCRSAAMADFQLRASPSTAKRLLGPHFFGRCQNKRKQCNRHSEISLICVPKTSAFRPSIDLDIAPGAREWAGICDLPSLPKVMAPHGGRRSDR